MYYFSTQCVRDSFNILKDSINNGFIGILGILHNINNYSIIPNHTYEIEDGQLSEWLDDECYLRDFNGRYGESPLYIRFSNIWDEYVKDVLIKTSFSVFHLIVFLYKYKSFVEKPSEKELLMMFLKDYHISYEIASNWFNLNHIELSYSESPLTKETYKALLGVHKYTISFSSPYSLESRAGELSRAPFFQTLYAGMDGIKCLMILKENIDIYYSNGEKKKTANIMEANVSLQQIIFGAPGTGKSFSIKSNPDISEDNTIRTTFHPDSDYSTFVGCYKPTKKATSKKPLIAAADFIEKAASISGVAHQVQFLCDNAESIIYAADEIGVSTNKLIWDSFKWHNETYFVSILNSILDERKLNATDEITYNFCPQAFTNAYIKAWKNPDTPIFLIIEEINRGNCAQIFGDIFQLLDRDENGFSRYDIAPDSDLQNYLRKAFEDTDIENESIKIGASMQLPPNLHIWATMNTSDQSLFPIDSAFKRRWDWKYIPIDYTDRGHYISCNGKKYSWAKFLEQVNQNIEGVTQSEDKKLGYWFTGNSASQLEITADKFVSKVVFFLWNDVFKDFGHNGKTIFKDDFSKFHMFFDFTGNVKEDVLEKFLKSLELTPNDATDKADSEETETAE